MLSSGNSYSPLCILSSALLFCLYFPFINCHFNFIDSQAYLLSFSLKRDRKKGKYILNRERIITAGIVIKVVTQCCYMRHTEDVYIKWQSVVQKALQCFASTGQHIHVTQCSSLLSRGGWLRRSIRQHDDKWAPMYYHSHGSFRVVIKLFLILKQSQPMLLRFAALLCLLFLPKSAKTSAKKPWTDKGKQIKPQLCWCLGL